MSNYSTMLNSEILDGIEDIKQNQFIAEMNVMNAMFDYYQKESTFMEHCNFDTCDIDEVFTEADTDSTTKSKFTSEGGKVLAFFKKVLTGILKLFRMIAHGLAKLVQKLKNLFKSKKKTINQICEEAGLQKKSKHIKEAAVPTTNTQLSDVKLTQKDFDTLLKNIRVSIGSDATIKIVCYEFDKNEDVGSFTGFDEYTFNRLVGFLVDDHLQLVIRTTLDLIIKSVQQIRDYKDDSALQLTNMHTNYLRNYKIPRYIGSELSLIELQSSAKTYSKFADSTSKILKYLADGLNLGHTHAENIRWLFNTINNVNMTVNIFIKSYQ